MKKVVKYRFGVFTALLFTLFGACKDQELEDFKLIETDPSEVSMDNTAGQIKKTNETVTIPLSVSLSSPATKAFQVGIQLNTDTVAGLIESGELVNTIGLNSGAIALPSVVKIPFGASSANFEVTLSVTALEHFFGQKVAFAFNLVDPGKGNRIGIKGSNLIVLNTLDLLNEHEIHYLSFTKGRDGFIEARNRKNYTITSEGVVVPVGVSLAGLPGSSFSIDTKFTEDTIVNLMEEGKLPENTVILDDDQFYLDKGIQVGSNTSSAPYELIIPSNVISANLDKVLAFSITMVNSSRHVIDKRYDNVLVLVYPSLIIEKDITNEGAWSVNIEGKNGADGFEGSRSLIDNNTTTKFLLRPMGGNLLAQLVYDTPKRLGAYILTSGNDVPGRDPKVWEILGSNDGENWDVLDRHELKETVFTGRRQTIRFEIEDSLEYTHYRMSVIETFNGEFQMSEFRMISIP